MRLGLNRLALLLLLFGLCRTAEARPSEEDPPQTIKSRLFEPEKTPFKDLLLAPFRAPEYVLRTVLYPVSRFVLWAEEVHLEDRIIDILSDGSKRIWFYPSADYSTNDGFFLGGKFLFKNMFYQRKNLSASADLYTNLDHKFSVSYSRSQTVSSPLSYKFKTSYGNNSNAKFYGFGIDSGSADKSVYADRKASASVRLGWRFPRAPFLTVSASVGPDYSRTGPGNPADERPSIDDLFDPDTLHGYDEENIWLRYGLAISYNSSLPSGNPSRGGRVSLGIDRFEDFLGGHTYVQLKGQATRMFSLGSPRRVLALSAQFKSVEDWGGKVPFQRLSSLGESSPLRGFSNGRFRDRRLLLGNLEYRFMVWQSASVEPVYGLGTLFLDVGRTFDQFEELGDGVIKYSVGTGFLIASTKSFYLRGQVGYGGEGVESIFSFGRAF
jgi:hypothetical protein